MKPFAELRKSLPGPSAEPWSGRAPGITPAVRRAPGHSCEVQTRSLRPARRALIGAGLAAALAQGWLARRAHAAAPESRLALVIGNADYKVGPLKNPVNDARLVGDNLRGLGFEVIQRENASLRDMLESMRQFISRGKDTQVRLLYYAGHGFQVKGRNYLLPVDSDIRAEDDVPTKSADVAELLDRLGQLKTGINIVILDACRNNPFAGGEVLGPDGRRLKFRGTAASGLAPLEAPLGTMVAFSTAPGGVALDSPDDRNSLYTKHLVSSLKTPGLPIEMLFKQVRLNVARETARLQVPWESSSLTGDFCFKPSPNGGCAAVRTAAN